MYREQVVRYASGVERRYVETDADIRATASFFELSLGRITHINGKRVATGRARTR